MGVAANVCTRKAGADLLGLRGPCIFRIWGVAIGVIFCFTAEKPSSIFPVGLLDKVSI